jgi:imidazolonepropionase-like amidohydrolase
MLMRKKILFAVIASVLFLAAYAGITQPAAKSLVLKGATLIDCTGSPALSNSVVVIEGRKIIAIGPAAKVAYPRTAQVKDVSGKYLVPGFIDTHAHVTFLQNPAGPDFKYDEATSIEVMKLLWKYGITTIRNPSSPALIGVSFRDQVKSGKIAGPRVFTAGDALNLPASSTNGPGTGVRTMGEVRQEVDRQWKAGVDYIKVYARLPLDLVRAAIEQAHFHKLKVVGHMGGTSWTEAAQISIDSITHGASWSTSELPAEKREEYRRRIQEEGGMKARIFWLESVDPDGPEIQRMISELVRKKVAVDPTLIAYITKFHGDDPAFVQSPDLTVVPTLMRRKWSEGSFVDDWTKEDFERAHAAWPKMLQLVRRYYEGGVRMTTGSDLPNNWVIPGLSLHQEFVLLVQAEIPSDRVLQMATRNGAEALGILAETGTLEKGKLANIVVLSADPRENIENTRKIDLVLYEGQIVHRK